MSIILRIIFLSSISKTNDVDDPDYLKSLFSFNTPPNIAYLTITILGIIVDSFLLTVWWSVSLKTYHIAFAFISMFQFCTGIAEIQININTMRADVHNKFNPKLCNIALMVTAAIYNQNSNALPLSNSILLGCNVACAVGLLFIAWHFRRRLPPAFQVEEYDISKLSPFQLEGFAILMERNFKYNGGISGKAAISLIKSYLACDLPGMRTKLIRTYNTNKSNPSKLWDTLDEEDILFRTRSRVTSDSATYIENDPFDVQSYKPLLKNQLKKLQKKDKNKNKKEAASLELLAENSQEFYDVLCNTESITLLTIIDKYDLSLYIPAKLGGKVLNKYFGADSKLPLLCIRFGLLGFHWPFRRSTFYCSPPKKPVARAGAVLYALSKWNSNLPRSERCRVLLDPTFKTPDTEKVLAVSGWYTAPIPNGHIIDLRPYTKKTPEQYFKLVKYRVQVQPFKQDKGEVIYIDNPLVEDCDLLMERWGDIYKRREQGGQSSYLINPTTNFVYSMVSFESGEHNANDDRSLMFLKVGDEYIASCIIFRLGKTITSDIQGLNGEISKKYKAYFVMMQEVIKLAFAEGKEFVDFGPTTEQPKVDIGCSIVPLVGSFDAGNPVMSWIWCFGLPLMDRIFVWTGGRCQFDLETAEVLPLAIKQTIETGASHSLQLSSYHCKRHKGQWVGGHDPSGHVFLLVHSSLFMFFEFIPFRAGVNQISQWFVMGLIGLWWFMLLMTNVYFHSITEKVVGLLFGYFAVAWVYVVSPAIALRSIKRPPSRKLDYN
ncbi:uncharacterized protein KQ657_001586 [Scheffersomyces spartinae]|uniref:BioF2-like acetyltransferase domain-containing protein n=1 Tax=Scheffersomyces spartinae TaxID=45513 RepID=A0A9P8AH62_9ASCO|nr:uncharacterized protein KQ657_001586 [Scheffersomyces spartinae]KAG7192491.1 hypothetical protein KQ657_001586 [Scheffersomyces spartinae]